MPTARAASSCSRLAGSALAAPLCRVAGVLRRPLLRASLPPELLLNGLHDEVHEGNVVGHTVQLEAAVKLFRDAGRQLRQRFFGLRHLSRLVLRPRWTSGTATAPISDGEGTTRRLRAHEAQAVGDGGRCALPEPSAH